MKLSDFGAYSPLEGMGVIGIVQNEQEIVHHETAPRGHAVPRLPSRMRFSVPNSLS